MKVSPTASRDCWQPWSAIWTRQPVCSAQLGGAKTPPPLGDEGVAALLLHQREVARRHADLLVEALRRLHDRASHGLILVAGEEVDVVVAKAAERVDLAVLGKLLGR